MSEIDSATASNAGLRLDSASDQLLDVVHEGATYAGFTVDALAAAGVPDADVLMAYQKRLCVAIDDEAEKLGSVLAPNGPCRMAEYQQAQAEALDALAVAATGQAVDAARYPMLAVTVGTEIDPQTGAKATDVVGVARSVKRAADAFLAFGVAIRGARLGGKAAVAATTSISAAKAAYDAIAWPPTA